MKEVRYGLDSTTGQPHIYAHNVCEDEVEEVLRSAGDATEPPVKKGRAVLYGFGADVYGPIYEGAVLTGARWHWNLRHYRL